MIQINYKNKMYSKLNLIMIYSKKQLKIFKFKTILIINEYSTKFSKDKQIFPKDKQIKCKNTIYNYCIL